MLKNDGARPTDAAPLNALRAFEAAASSGSFSAASRRLGVGQSTISRHISTLEDWLGVPLFSRTSSSSELTSHGRELSKTTRACFGDLDVVLADLRRVHEHAGRVSVDVSVTFAVLWLLPRLDDFTIRHGDLDVRVVTRAESAAPAQDADVVVNFGRPDLDAGDAVVFPERLIVIRSPNHRLRSEHLTLDSLAAERLLGLDGPTHQDDWLTIFDSPPPVMSGRYASYAVYLQAVLEGHGIGLGWRPLIDQHLDDGRLVEVGRWDVTTERAYYVPAARTPNLDAQRFAAWLTTGPVPGRDAADFRQ